MNILLLASHAVAEYDDLRMFTDLGYDCFAPGGYEVPSRSGEGIRPALPDAPHHPELVEAINTQRAFDSEELGDPGPNIDWGKAHLPDPVIDWADVIIVHHFPQVWIGGQWDRIRHKRVIWRTCGQSDPRLEIYMTDFAEQGLEIVRYSPAERRYFERVGYFAGEDALIRFGKYPDDYGPWTGEFPGVINITQHLAQRGEACGYGFWQEATRGLARPFGGLPEDGPPPPFALPLGPGSEAIGGPGALTYTEMLDWLRHARAYLYTGTRPASYTLGLIEAMLSGVPVVTIPASVWGDGWDGADLFEGHEIVRYGSSGEGSREGAVATTRSMLGKLLGTWVAPDVALHEAQLVSTYQRARAVELFGIETIGAQWKAFLG